MTEKPAIGKEWSVFRGDALDAYGAWPAPAAIISDGAYGVGGFPGDPRTTDTLPEWYTPHIESWSQRAMPSTTLWFWNTELGWATIHPILVENGWDYVQTVVWDKGIGHIAGNVNGHTIRQFPVVSEICAFYRRRLEFSAPNGGVISVQKWLRHEWLRAGLPLHMANKACGVANAATRKYLTQDWLWYLPPPEKMERLVSFANRYGRAEGAPYYSLDGASPLTAEDWDSLRHEWHHVHGLTNVWSSPPLNGRERYKGNGVRSAPRVYKPGPHAAVHLNQKPLEFMRRIITASTNQGDVIWEPFGGLCSAVVAAVESGRRGFAAELVGRFADLAVQRIEAVTRASQLPI